jgi:hypothetical protein
MVLNYTFNHDIQQDKENKEENYSLLGCDAKKSSRKLPAHLGNLLPPYSG